MASLVVLAKNTMRITLGLFMLLDAAFLLMLVCYPHNGERSHFSNNDMSLSVVEWNTHKLSYHMAPSKDKTTAYERPKKLFAFISVILAGDIHCNPGPVRFPCGVCKKPVATNHRALECEGCQYWVHIKCGGITPKEYEQFQTNKLL